MRQISRFTLLLASLVILATGPVQAGVYHPDILLIENFDDDGNAQPLGVETFWNQFLKAVEIATDRPGTLRADSPRMRLQERVAQLRKTPNRTEDENNELTGALLMLGVSDEALGLARKVLPPTFISEVHLAKAYQLRDLPDEAQKHEDSAIRDTDFPTHIFHLKKRQLSWYAKVEKEYYLPWLENRFREAEQRRLMGKSMPDIRVETLDPLFPFQGKTKTAPIHFVNASGIYAPGELAASEKAKLPPDAVAIVQQLLLWNPGDLRLAWLLAELYIVDGRLEAADQIFEYCRQMGHSPDELLQHLRLLQPLVDAIRDQRTALNQAEQDRLRVERETLQQQQERERMNRIYIVTAAGLAILVLAYWQTREIVRKIARRRRGQANA